MDDARLLRNTVSTPGQLALQLRLRVRKRVFRYLQIARPFATEGEGLAFMDDDVIVDPYSRAELFRRGLLRKLTLMKGIRYLRRIT